jgi:YD repeat-containing protein
MRYPRYGLGVAVVNGKIYAMGGRESGVSVSYVEVYDPVYNTWTTKTSMYRNRAYFGTTVANGKIYTIGGLRGSTCQTIVEVYDPVLDKWTTAPSFPDARCGLVAVTLNNKIYAIGGNNGRYPNASNAVYDLATDTWSYKTGMFRDRNDAGGTVIEGKIYIMGGCYGSYLNTVEVYDPATDSWVYKPSLTTARYGLGVTTLNKSIYAIGGFNGSFLGTNEEYELPVPVTGVGLNKTSTTIIVDGTETLIPTILPTNATHKEVIWSSSNTAVAAVSSSGAVTGIGAGIATIYATTVDGGFKAACTVTVVVAVTGVSLNKTSTCIGVGGKELLIATITPANATNKSITWSSSNPAIATVDANGFITAVSKGDAVITVTTVDRGLTASCTVKVGEMDRIFIYDDQNRLSYIRLPNGTKIQYQYDVNGNLINTVTTSN